MTADHAAATTHTLLKVQPHDASSRALATVHALSWPPRGPLVGEEGMQRLRAPPEERQKPPI